jgi:hypothetical protein
MNTNVSALPSAESTLAGRAAETAADPARLRSARGERPLLPSYERMVRHLHAAVRWGLDRSLAPLDMGREWALLDTRGCPPGSFYIRAWTNRNGVTAPIEHPPAKRVGGAIGLLMLDGPCAAAVPCPPGVDDGVGLLLVGLCRMVAVPLATSDTSPLAANWLLVLSARADDLDDAEIRFIERRSRAIVRFDHA